MYKQKSLFSKSKSVIWALSILAISTVRADYFEILKQDDLDQNYWSSSDGDINIFKNSISKYNEQSPSFNIFVNMISQHENGAKYSDTEHIGSLISQPGQNNNPLRYVFKFEDKFKNLDALNNEFKNKLKAENIHDLKTAIVMMVRDSNLSDFEKMKEMMNLNMVHIFPNHPFTLYYKDSTQLSRQMIGMGQKLSGEICFWKLDTLPVSEGEEKGSEKKNQNAQQNSKDTRVNTPIKVSLSYPNETELEGRCSSFSTNSQPEDEFQMMCNPFSSHPTTQFNKENFRAMCSSFPINPQPEDEFEAMCSSFSLNSSTPSTVEKKETKKRKRKNKLSPKSSIVHQKYTAEEKAWALSEYYDIYQKNLSQTNFSLPKKISIRVTVRDKFYTLFNKILPLCTLKNWIFHHEKGMSVKSNWSYNFNPSG